MRYFKKNAAFIFFPVIAVLTAASRAGAQAGGRLESPLNPAISTIPALLAAFLKAVVLIALPIIGLAIVYVGFLFVSARGNTGKLTTARAAFLNTMIGAVLILGAWLLANLIGNTVSQLLP